MHKSNLQICKFEKQKAENDGHQSGSNKIATTQALGVGGQNCQAGHCDGIHKRSQENKLFSENDKIPIWFCWFQGEEKMSEVSKICYNRLKEIISKDRFEIKFISFDNIKNYVRFPEFILRKLQVGHITYTHLSDHLRYYLLAKYGGFWVDSTIFFTECDFEKISQLPFFTGKCPKIIKNEPGKCQSFNGLWYVNSQKVKMFFGILYELCLFYWLGHNKLLDYIIVDYIMNFEREIFPWAREMFDDLEPNMDNIYDFDRNMNKTYSDDLYNDLFVVNYFQNLSNKHKYNKIDSTGNKTLHGYLCEKFLS